MNNNFIDIIKERGFTSTEKMTDEKGLRELCNIEKHGPQTAYIGFDCTAKSLHVGSLLQIMLLRWWQKCGHRPIVLLGGGTTKIGDPSGKDESRPPLTDAQIQENMDSLKQAFSQFLSFSNNESPTPENDAIMVNNDEWLSGLNYAQFLREYGRHFSINRMLTMDSVKLRLEREQTLSFLEFNYMILQAYDFVKLAEAPKIENGKNVGGYNCRVQMGGSDQWGNIVNGIELHKRIEVRKHWHTSAILDQAEFVEVTGLSDEEIAKVGRKEADRRDDINYENYKVFGITSPLLTTSSGAKMGKTAAGAVWLNAEMLSPNEPEKAAYVYWQFWRNTEDADVIRFLKLFTELPLEQITEYESWLGSSKINDAKIILATEATAMLHGHEAAERAKKTATETFSGSRVSADLPTIEITKSEVEERSNLIRWIVKAGFAVSNSEARSLIEQVAIGVNDTKITDVKYRLSSADFAQGFAKLSKGKTRHMLIKIQ